VSRPLGLLVKGAVVALVVATLAVGAVLLWPTAVPDDLSLSDVGRTQSGVVRIDAPRGRCWSATINGETRQGCGPTAIDVEIQGSIQATFEKRDDDGRWDLTNSLEVDGRQVRFSLNAGGFFYEVTPPADVFPDEVVEEAEEYERLSYLLWILSTWAVFATLVVYARRGTAFMRESSAGPIGTGMLLGMLGLAIVWLVNLPFRIAGHWWARRHDLTETNYLWWILDDWLILGAQFLAASLALLVVMGLARWLGDWWWLPGAAAFTAIVGFVTFAAPLLEYETEPLRDETLLVAEEAYRSQLGLPDLPVRVEEVSDEILVANAYAYGIGPTRRVVLWDTILQDPFEPEEQRVVLAHELAHHSQEHLPEGVGWYAIFAVPGAFLLMLATRRRGGMGAPEAVPLALLVAFVFQLATAPAANVVSRRVEAEADWKALEVTRDPVAFEGLMAGLAESSLGDPSPPEWAQLVLGSHPTLEDRVAMARAWSLRNGR
jgi:STE24 endopeptidase